ncbi:HigA family addiction module antitoxin [Streptococcus caballi]|uniref:HigA family addiction module antitoxin n=1 Tax=Streptococcus caballi TaxID=439220 RepID=UPI00037CF00F|nr:HigA family addiction module antitoxin [Streptococcus caballi]
MSHNEQIYEDLIAFHPGSYVEDIIDDMNMSQKEFAERLGVSPKTVSKIVNGEESISKDTANKLSKLTGISITTWLNLQNTYDMKLIEIENQKNEDERRICQMIDFTYFKEHHFVETKKYNMPEKLAALRKLLQVSSLSYLTQFNTNVSYRNTKGFAEKSIVNSNIMLELATGMAKDATDNKLDRRKLERLLSELRAMTLQDVETFYPVLKEKLLACGVVLIGLPKLRNASLNGATKRFKNGSVLLMMTDKNKSSDIFWFSLFHELGHILNNDFYSDYSDDEVYQQKEATADQFAQDLLIPSRDYDRFISEKQFDRASIRHFAEEIGIHPSIVVGRLQREEFISYTQFSDMKINYNIVITPSLC